MDMTHQIQQAPYRPRRDRADQPVEQRPTRVGAIVAAIAIISALVIGFGSDVAATGGVEADSIEIYVVQPGDTLWEIAGELAVPGEDVRPLVDQLQEVAGGSRLEVGQRLVIDHAMLRG